jgi:hypothetical protein
MEVRLLSRAPKGRLAQLVRASRLHREGRRFESFSDHQKICYNISPSLGSSVVERSPEEAGVVSSILTRGTMQVWFNGRTCPCQGQSAGSIPATCSML